MLITGPDPRPRWHALAGRTDAEAVAQLRALPAGARAAPLPWVCETHVDSRGHFDKDAQGEVFFDFTVVTGWRADPDPRVHQAGALSFHSADQLDSGLLARFPGEDQLGAELSAITLHARSLCSAEIAALGRARPWADLALWAADWSAPGRAAGVRALAAAFPALRGLELHTAALDATDLAVLADAPMLATLEDLTLGGSALDAGAAGALADRLGALVHLDLHGARLGPATIERFAPRLGRARRLQLAGNPLGDAGLRALLAAGALDHVEDLWLSGCGLTDASAHALADAALPALRGLWLDGNALTDAGLARLIGAPVFGRLTGASLWQRGRTDGAGALLAGHPLAACLHQTARLPGVNALWFLGRAAP